MNDFTLGTSIAQNASTEWPTISLFLRDIGRRSYPIDQLVYLQAVANYSWLNWLDGNRMLMPRTLKYYTPKLPADHFIRLHRSCVVNAQFVSRLERTDAGGLVYLTTGEILPVSRRRWTSVRDSLMVANTNIN